MTRKRRPEGKQATNRRQQAEQYAEADSICKPYVATYAIPRPITPNHRLYHALCNDPSKYVVLCKGWAGTGKTIVMAYHAAKRLKANDISRIVITRSLEGVGKDPGAYKGNAFEKNEPKLRGLLTYIASFMNQSVELLISQGKLVVQGLADIQGQDFTDAWLLVTECQTLTAEQMYQIVTRGAEKIILEGDTCPAQLTNRRISVGEDGLSFLMDTIGHLSTIGVVEMCDDEDIVRKPYMRDIIKCMMPALAERRIKKTKYEEGIEWITKTFSGYYMLWKKKHPPRNGQPSQ